MTSFIVLSSLVNIALGYGLAVYFGKAQLRIATRVNSRPVPMSGQGPAPVAVASSPSIDSTPTAMEPALEEPVAEPDEDSAADPVAATITPEPATEQPAVEPIANNSAEPQPAALSSPAPPEARQRANIDESAEELTGANPSGATEPREATAEPKDVEAKAEPKDTKAKAEPKISKPKQSLSKMTIWKCFLSICWQRSKNRKQKSLSQRAKRPPREMSRQISKRRPWQASKPSARNWPVCKTTPRRCQLPPRKAAPTTAIQRRTTQTSANMLPSAQNNRPPTTRGGTDS